VSFEVGRGDVSALLGPNGSGKSTVMRCITGFLSPTSGTVRIGGVSLEEAGVAGRRRVGYLPEQVSLYPELDVRRYLAFVAGMKGLSGKGARRAVAEQVARCGLEEVADRPTGKLSKGYRQRVGLAQALLGDPEVLVLDEPTVGLDPVQTLEMRGLVRSLSGRTVLLSTHVLSEAAAMCSRVVILSRGRLLAEDTPVGLARRMEGAGRLRVRVEAPREAAIAVLGNLPGVERVEVEGEGDEAAYVLHGRELEPVQRAVGPAVVGHGWTLLEIGTSQPTLEDLFVQMVG